MADAKEWARNGSFMKKPTTGWLHDDAALSQGDGVYYPVKYIGTIPVEMSMRTLRFEDRTTVTREAITLCCEAAGLREPMRRKVSKVVKQCLVADPTLKNLNIKLTVSTTGIALVVIETNQVIANHIMPCISFATGGDATDYDVIGYIAKDARNKRECHVFDCGHYAHDVIATMGQAFELRYKAFLKKGQQPAGRSAADMLPPAPISNAGYRMPEQVYDEAGYGAGAQVYDDLPTGAAPAAGGYAPAHFGAGGMQQYGDQAYAGGYGEVQYGAGDQVYDNAGTSGAAVVAGAFPTYGEEAVYDNNGGAATGASAGQYGEAQYGGEGVYDNKAGATATPFSAPAFESAYDNSAGGAGVSDYDDDMNTEAAGGQLMAAPGGAELGRSVQDEPWFHGQLRREAADRLLTSDGDFLVRESIGSPGQYVLSCIQDGSPKHLLLVDPSGRVRTKDMGFDSVSHLINYHIRARIPIISRGSRVTLGEPVARVVDTDPYDYHN